MANLRSNTPFMRLFLGRLVTNIGDSLYLIGAMWLVYDLTGSSFYTGVAGFLVQAPTSMQFLYGPLVDRWDLRRTLVATQVAQGVFVLIIPFAAMVGHLSVWVVLVVLPLLSLLNQFVYPAQSAVLPRIVDDDQLVRANSLFTTVYQGSETVFNGIGGVVISIVGAVTLFAIDSVTFFAAALFFLGVVIPGTEEEENGNEAGDESYVDKLRGGFDYLRGSIILSMILGAAVANFGSGALLAVMPAFADALGGPETYGLLMAALSAGQLAGAVGASAVEDIAFGVVSVFGLFFTGLGLVTVALVPGRLPTVALLLVATVPVGTFNVMFFSLIQASVDDTYLGRVTAMVSSTTAVMIPAGSLIGGAVGDAFGPSFVLYAFGGLIALTGVYFLSHARIRSLPAIPKVEAATIGLERSSTE